MSIDSDRAAALHLGRPRDDLREQAILDAAVDLLCEVGYDGFSMDALAARAKASKATIYRRWSGKADLVTEAVRRRKCSSEFVPDTGSLRNDLIEFIRCESTSHANDDAAVFLGVLRAMHHDEELAKLMNEQVILAKAAVIGQLVERSIARGETPVTVDPSVMIETLWAVMFSRIVVQGRELDEAFIVQSIDKVALPLLR